jgi:hypothetical protein
MSPIRGSAVMSAIRRASSSSMRLVMLHRN